MFLHEVIDEFLQVFRDGSVRRRPFHGERSGFQLAVVREDLPRFAVHAVMSGDQAEMDLADGGAEVRELPQP